MTNSSHSIQNKILPRRLEIALSLEGRLENFLSGTHIPPGSVCEFLFYIFFGNQKDRKKTRSYTVFVRKPGNTIWAQRS